MIKAPDVFAILDEWEQDAEIPKPHRLTEATRNIPKLHSKYTRYMATHNLMAKKTLTDFNNLRNIKWDYLSGDLNNPQSIKEHNLPGPYLNVIHSKEAKERKLESDPDLVKLLLKKAAHEEAAETCKMIVKEISARTWQVRVIADWERFYGSSDGSFVDSVGKRRETRDIDE